MKKIFLFSSLFLLSSFAVAQDESAILKDGLNMTAFQQCKTALQACQRDLYLRPTCLQQKLYRRPECAQLAAIEKLSSVDADQIYARNEGNLSLVAFHYPADGQTTYAILSEGRLIPVAIDPKKTFPQLEKQYPNTLFFMRVLRDPIYTVDVKSGLRQFTASIRITKDCSVCETVQTAKIILEFNMDGKYLSTKVIGT